VSLTRTRKKREDTAAEVVGSTPTRSTFINLVKYGIVLSLILTIVGQIQQQKQKRKRKKEND
jgi:hypothetical protein